MKRILLCGLVALVVLLDAVPQAPASASTQCSLEAVLLASGTIDQFSIDGLTVQYQREAGQRVVLHAERTDNQGGLETDYLWYEGDLQDFFASDGPSLDWRFTAPGTGTYDHFIYETLVNLAAGAEITYIVMSDDCRLMFVDGRLNNFDMAAPVAVYPYTFASGTGLRFYAIDEAGAGTLALEVTPEQIAAVPEMPAVNTLIASTPDGSVAFYRLTTGEFQVNAGTYVITFSALYAGASYYTP